MRSRSVRFAALLAASVLALSFSATSARAADAYEIDGAHTSVLFRVKHLGVSNFYGRFNKVSGSATLDVANNHAGTSVNFEIEAASVDTNHPKRDDHLRGPDFFNAKQFPKISFKSTKVESLGDGRFKVSGDMTLLGVTKPVSAEFTHTGSGDDPWGNYRMGAEGTFTIKRSDFGMNFMQGGGLGDDVKVIVSVEAIRKSQG